MERNIEKMIKKTITETIVEEMFRELGFFVLKLGQENLLTPIIQLQDFIKLCKGNFKLERPSRKDIESVSYLKDLPDFVEYLRLFQFPPIHGHPMLEELTKRAKILVETYEELFSGRPREKSLKEYEKHLLLDTAVNKWEP